jgi:hypothetical protein
LIFLNLAWLSHPRHSRDFLDINHSAGCFLEKVRRVTENVSFDGLFWGRLREMKIKMIFDDHDDSGERSE